ncbi:MAG: O-antigen ligase family protein [Candidatus Aminicenantes bacterium]|nr:MAG: O-antigen ligase family protein [Candidatus Aminicenantes bacterium]
MRIDWRDPRIFALIIVSLILVISLFAGQIISGYSYKIPLALILGAMIFLTILVNTDAGLAILIFSMLLSPEIVAGQVPGRDIVIRFDDLLLAVIIFTWVAKTAINKGLALFVKTPLNKAIGFYILICVIATLRGAYLGYVGPAKGFFYIVRYIEYFLLYMLVANHIHSRKQIKFFITAFFITCTIVCTYGILQIPSGLRVSAPFEGEEGEPNTFGGYLLIILCIAVGILLQNISRRLNITLLGLCVLISFPFLFTLSRASYFAIIFSFLTFIILSKRRVVLISGAAAIIIIVALLRPEAVFSRVKYTFQQKETHLKRIGNIYFDPSSSARIRQWDYAFQEWKKDPFLGRGVTGYPFIDGQYFQILPEVGLMGFLAFLWLLWAVFRNSLSIHNKMDDKLYKGLSLGFITAFVGLVFHALTANTFIIVRIMEPFWFIAGIIMMLPELKEEKETGPVNSELTQRGINSTEMFSS